MNFILDTCVFSEFVKPKPDSNVVRWIDDQIEETLYISVVSIGEIRKGIAALPKSKRKAKLQDWLNLLVARFERRTISLGVEEWIVWGDLCGRMANKGIAFPFMDSLIAATAIAHGMTIVTRNADDFKRTRAKTLNIWS